jgi:hypothetical protein
MPNGDISLPCLKASKALELSTFSEKSCLQPSHDIDLVQRKLNTYGLVGKASINRELERLTGSIILIREVRAIGRARSEETPERTATLALTEAMQIYMPRKFTLLKRLSKVLIIDLVTVCETQHYWKIDMTV